jgi:type I restriction enzyme, S subunit
MSEYWGGSIPWVTPADLAKNDDVFFRGPCKRITEAGYESCSTVLLPSGSILFSSRAPIGHSAIVASPVCTNQGFKSFVPGPDVDPAFAYFAIRAVTPRIISAGRGATFAEVNTDIMESVRLPYTDITDQRRIGARLLMAHRLARTRRFVLEKSEGLLRAVFLEMFGDPIKNPKGYPLSPLGDVIEPARPITYGILKPGPNIPDGIPYIRVTDMVDGRVLVAQVKRTTTTIAHEYRRSRLKAADLLMSIRGHVGRFAVVPSTLEGANITQDTARLAPIKTMSSRYLKGCLESAGMQERMSRLTRGVAVTGINLSDVKELPIPVAPKPMQERFAVIAEAHEKLRATQHEALRQAEHLFQTLLHEAFGEVA